MRTLVILLTLCAATLADGEVTEITGPLTKNGRIDFFKVLEDQIYPPGFTTEDNGFRTFVRQFGTAGYDLPDENRDFYRHQIYEKLKLNPDTSPRLKLPQQPHKIVENFDYGSPWTLKDFPMLTNWVKEIDKPLDTLAQAIRKPVFRPPLLEGQAFVESGIPQPLIGILLPDMFLCREMARTFRARAMYRVGQGDIDGAIDDKLTLHRLGRLIAPGGTTITYLVGIVTESEAMAIPINANPEHPLTKEQIQRVLAGIDALPQRTPLSIAYEYERLAALSAAQSVAIGQEQNRERLLSSFPLYAVVSRPLDWNLVYRRINTVYDALQEPPPQEKFHAFVEAAENQTLLQRTARLLLTPNGTEMFIADLLIAVSAPVIDSLEKAVHRLECSDNLQRLAWAMMLYRLDNVTSRDKLPDENWAVEIKKYLGENPEQYFCCPVNPAPKGETTYALVQYGDKVPEHHETILLVELEIPVPLDKAVMTLEEVLARKRIGNSHAGGLNTVRQSGAVRTVFE